MWGYNAPLKSVRCFSPSGRSSCSTPHGRRLQRKELRQALTRTLASLPPKYREVLVVRDVAKLSVAETAQVLGITETNVQTRLLRARLEMRDALAPGFSGNWTRERRPN